MPQNATLGDEPGELRPPQLQVLAALLGGSTVTAAAHTAGADRTTVHRWMRDHWDFQAALHRGRREHHASLRARLERIAERAVEALYAAIEAGDARVALALPKGLGVLDDREREIPTADPAVLQEEVELAECEATIGSCGAPAHSAPGVAARAVLASVFSEAGDEGELPRRDRAGGGHQLGHLIIQRFCKRHRLSRRSKLNGRPGRGRSPARVRTCP